MEREDICFPQHLIQRNPIARYWIFTARPRGNQNFHAEAARHLGDEASHAPLPDAPSAAARFPLSRRTAFASLRESVVPWSNPLLLAARVGKELPSAEVLAELAPMFAGAMDTAEAAEGRASFMEKRKPVFKGR